MRTDIMTITYSFHGWEWQLQLLGYFNQKWLLLMKLFLWKNLFSFSRSRHFIYRKELNRNVRWCFSISSCFFFALLLIFVNHSYFSCRVRVDMHCILSLTLPNFFPSIIVMLCGLLFSLLRSDYSCFFYLLVDSFSFELGIVKLANDTISNRSSLESFPISQFIMFVIVWFSCPVFGVKDCLKPVKMFGSTWTTSIIIQTLCNECDNDQNTRDSESMKIKRIQMDGFVVWCPIESQ